MLTLLTWLASVKDSFAAVPLNHNTPKSYNLPILIQVVSTIAPWLRSPDCQSFTALPLSSKVAKADSLYP